MNKEIIRVENLVKSYGRSQVLNGLSFTVHEGSVYGLLGPNGVGKTTTIQILMNLLGATQGKAEVFGKPCSTLKPKDFKSIAYVSENQRLPESMTLEELSLYLAPFYDTWDGAYEQGLAKQLDLPRNVRLKNMSRGMKMKAALCVAMAYHPRLVVLDEPFSGLDPVVRDEFSAAVLALVADSGCSVLLSSHDVEEVQRLCDWVGIMKEGKMELSEPLERLQARHQKIRVRLPAHANSSLVLDKKMELMESSGSLLEILHRDYRGEESVAALESRLPEDSVIEFESLSLREIYLSIHRKSRNSL